MRKWQKYCNCYSKNWWCFFVEWRPILMGIYWWFNYLFIIGNMYIHQRCLHLHTICASWLYDCIWENSWCGWDRFLASIGIVELNYITITPVTRRPTPSTWPSLLILKTNKGAHQLPSSAEVMMSVKLYSSRLCIAKMSKAVVLKWLYTKYPSLLLPNINILVMLIIDYDNIKKRRIDRVFNIWKYTYFWHVEDCLWRTVCIV
jgi:hypothetical protein